MSITVTGKVEKKGFGTGTWALVADDGKTYELRKAPPELQEAKGKVKVEGEIRKDVMTLAMIGPVLEVKSFKTL